MRSQSKTPFTLGYRMPAEWEPHEATWIGWPHNRTDWPGKFAAIPWVYGEMVRRISEGESVRILVNDAAHRARAERVLTKVGAGASSVDFLRFPTDRGWTRDFGPIFVRSRDRKAIVRFRFNAWARYPEWKKDDVVSVRASRHYSVELFPATTRAGREVVLEGGAIDPNGKGVLLATEECLLDPEVQARNPGLSRDDLEWVLRAYLGATRVIWLGKGIAGDDTHGHVDDLCRFVGPQTVVLCEERDRRDENHLPLEENRERLEGTGLEVVRIPMPRPLFFEGRRLPASYANFTIANAAVLVPTFNDPQDRVALGILGELFRDRPVVGIHAVDLVWGFGTLHCLTQQEPRI